jgi:hypothetical protein
MIIIFVRDGTVSYVHNADNYVVLNFDDLKWDECPYCGDDINKLGICRDKTCGFDKHELNGNVDACIEFVQRKAEESW